MTEIEPDSPLRQEKELLADVLLRPETELEAPGTGQRHAPAWRSAPETGSLFEGAEEAASTAAPREETEAATRAAPLLPRLKAFLTDGLISILVAGASLLAAAAVVRRAPDPSSWIWAGAFALLTSFFLVVATLVLFGCTPGMALAEISARSGNGERPDIASAILRWLLTGVTALLAGLPLILVLFDRAGRTPADRLSGFPLRILDPEEPIP